MLGESVKRVESIVSDTKSKIGTLSSVGQEKVALGTKTAKECEDVLDQILVNVLEVNDKVSEITNASNEQASGIKEVAKAMSQLDEMTHSTSTISIEALQSSEVLNTESKRLAEVVDDLSSLVSGGKAIPRKENVVNISERRENNKNEENIELREEVVTADSPTVTKKAVGSSLDVPSADDERFEDV